MKGKHTVILVLMALVAAYDAVGYAEEKKTEAQTEAAQTPPPEVAVARAVSQKDKDDAIGSVQAAEAQVLASRAEVRKAELDLSFTKIKSPIDGIAGAAKAQLGDLVGRPQALELTTVSTVDPIKVFVPISERQYLQAMASAKTQAAAPGQSQFELLSLIHI